MQVAVAPTAPLAMLADLDVRPVPVVALAVHPKPVTVEEVHILLVLVVHFGCSEHCMYGFH